MKKDFEMLKFKNKQLEELFQKKELSFDWTINGTKNENASFIIEMLLRTQGYITIEQLKEISNKYDK